MDMIQLYFQYGSKLVIDKLNNNLKSLWHIDSNIKEAQQLI